MFNLPFVLSTVTGPSWWALFILIRACSHRGCHYCGLVCRRVSSPFRPRPTNAARAIQIVSLLLLAGDVELNPRPVTHVNIPDWINIGRLNCFSASGKVALIHNIIAGYKLDFLALGETWFTTDKPVSIMNDIALCGSR
jgi:hypothetical protein